MKIVEAQIESASKPEGEIYGKPVSVSDRNDTFSATIRFTSVAP